MKRISLSPWLLLLCITSVFANGDNDQKITKPVDNGYPYFISGSVFPNDQGQLEITMVPMYFRADHRRDTIWLQQASYGITDSWLVYMSIIPYMIHRQPELVIRKKIISSDRWLQESGNGDAAFGMQYSWMYIKNTTCSAAVTFDIAIPSGIINKNLTDGMIYYTPTVILAKDFIHNKWRTELFAQGGISFAQRGKRHSDPRLDEPPANLFIFNGGIAERSERVNYSLEFNWITSTWNHDGDDNEIYITPGVYLYVRKDVAIGLGVPFGLTKTSADYQIIGNILIDLDTIFSKKKNGNGDDKDKDKKDAKSKSKTKKTESTFQENMTSPSSTTPMSAPKKSS